MRRLRFDNRSRAQITTLIEQHGRTLRLTQKQVHRCLAELGEELFFKLIDLDQGDNCAKAQKAIVPAKHWQELRTTARALIVSGACLSPQALAVSGDDLQKAGFSGKDVGTALKKLYDKVLDGTLENQRELLLKELNRM